jgi:hypothetical protein
MIPKQRSAFPDKPITSEPTPKRDITGGEGKNTRTLYAVLLTGMSLALAPVQLAQSTLQDPSQLIGKKVIAQRQALCEPGTYDAVVAYAGKPAMVLSVKPSKAAFPLSNSQLSKLPPNARALVEDQQKAATVLVQFEDGKKLDTCLAIGPARLSEYFELAEGETLSPVPTQAPVSDARDIQTQVADGLPTDHLSEGEIASAIAAPANTGFANIEDMGFATPSACQAQVPSESIFTPIGWLNAQNLIAKRQYLPFHPTSDDTLRVVTILSKGCASGTPSGPVCETISRVALLSDKEGKVIVEAIHQWPLGQSWRNGFGASASCSALVSQFSMSDVQKVRNSKGEFLVVTFNGTARLKIWTVKEKHIKKLGI